MVVDHRRLLLDMFEAAVAAAAPALCLPRHLPEPPRGRTVVVGAGKAAAGMAAAVEANWPGPLEGVVVTRHGHDAPCRRIQVIEAGHPVPDAAGPQAARDPGGGERPLRERPPDLPDLGVALASGAPLYSGIVAGVVGGIVVGLLSKSNLSVAGPAAGLSAIVLAAITQLGAFDIFLCSVLIAGVLQIALGFLGAGVVANYLPTNVVEGMLAAIGIIIILKQIPLAIGFDKDHHHYSFEEIGGGNTFTVLADALSAVTPGAALIAAISLAILIVWPRIPALKRTIYFPAPLAVVIVSILMNELFRLAAPGLIVDQAHLVSLPVAHNAGEFFAAFLRPNFSGFLDPRVWIVGATVAAVASVETLLSIEAIDRLDPRKRRTPPNHELKAQGVGNLVSGLLGGLPVTSVVIRSSANLDARAQSKLSTITHGGLLLVCAALIPSLINMIPLFNARLRCMGVGQSTLIPAVAMTLPQ